jgi:hypoxanthine phosphoribosyltransferase
MLPSEQAWEILHRSEKIHSAAVVSAAVQRLAGEITAALAGEYPLALSVMGGGVVFTGQILPLLAFPLEFDYLHVTRYRDSTRGGAVEWKVLPRVPVKDRVVLVLDDILDEGETLAAVRDVILERGARACYCAVFADKAIGRPKPLTADFIGISVPNRYVFGFGMDVNGAWRNLPEIYALKE